MFCFSGVELAFFCRARTLSSASVFSENRKFESGRDLHAVLKFEHALLVRTACDVFEIA